MQVKYTKFMFITHNLQNAGTDYVYMSIISFVFRILSNQIMHFLNYIICFYDICLKSYSFVSCSGPVVFVSACQSRVLLQAGAERRERGRHGERGRGGAHPPSASDAGRRRRAPRPHAGHETGKSLCCSQRFMC